MWTGSWLPALATTTNQPLGMHFGHVHVLASSPCLPPFLGPKFLLAPHLGVRFWFGFTQESSICPCHLTTLFLSYSLCLWCNLLEVLKFSLYFTCNLMWYICVTFHPTKRKVIWYHALCFLCLFASLLWNSFMASWACSMSNSFTQDASIGWYPFHLTKYSRSHPLSCLHLSTTSILNSGSLWTKSGGGLELCSRLGL
jgi:hypothetical protein